MRSLGVEHHRCITAVGADEDTLDGLGLAGRVRVHLEGPESDLESIRVWPLVDRGLEPVLADVAPRAAEVGPHLDRAKRAVPWPGASPPCWRSRCPARARVHGGPAGRAGRGRGPPRPRPISSCSTLRDHRIDPTGNPARDITKPMTPNRMATPIWNGSWDTANTPSMAKTRGRRPHGERVAGLGEVQPDTLGPSPGRRPRPAAAPRPPAPFAPLHRLHRSRVP